jgi:predicted SAM-dependent methyltransferase
MKLNVGCSWPTGRYKQDEWINLDIFENSRVNVKGDALKLPFATSSIDEIHCVHVLEHLTRDKYPQILREMHRVIKPGGFVYVEVPDFRGTINRLQTAFENNDVDAIHVWTTSVYGKSEREGMSHYWGFYEGLLRREFRHQGFKEVERLTEIDDMISTHHKQEPVLLVRGTK